MTLGRAYYLPAGVGEEHVEGGEIALAVAPAADVEAGDVPGLDVVFQRQAAQLPHRQVAVGIDGIGRQPADVPRRPHDPDRGDPQPAGGDRRRGATARPAGHEQGGFVGVLSRFVGVDRIRHAPEGHRGCGGEQEGGNGADGDGHAPPATGRNEMLPGQLF